MKESRKIIILAGLLTLTVACCVLLSFPGRGESEGTSEEMPVVTAVSAGDVRAVALINETGSIGLLNLPEGIAVDGADAAEYSQSKLITIVYSLSHLKAQRAFDAPEDQAEKDVYGFSEPSAQVSLLLEDTTIRLVLGRRSPVSGEHYLKVEGDPAVYMVDEETSEMMLQSVSDLRDLSMYPALTQETLKDLTQIKITNPKGEIVLQQIASDTVSSFYGMTSPVTAVLDWKNVDNAVLNPLRELLPKHFVSDDKPLSDYGLDEPEFTLELTISGNTYTCGFAQKNPDTWYCANLAGTLVSEIDASTAELLQTDFMDLIGGSIYTAAAADVSLLSAKYGEKVVELELTGESAALTGYVGDRQMDYLEVLDFYDRIDSIPAAAVYDETEPLASAPVLTLTVSRRNGSEDILEFYPVPKRQCAVYVNGACEFTTYAAVVSDIMEAFDRLGT